MGGGLEEKTANGVLAFVWGEGLCSCTPEYCFLRHLGILTISQPGFLNSPMDLAADSLIGKHGSAPRTAVLGRTEREEVCLTPQGISNCTRDTRVVQAEGCRSQGTLMMFGDSALITPTLSLRWERGLLGMG